MSISQFIKGLAPIAALAMAAATTACNTDVSANGEKGERLEDLDLAGKNPTSLVLAGPDTVIVTRGDALKIEVQGDAAAKDAVRFTLDGNTLGVLRPGKSSNRDAKATVRVTLPALEKLTVAGSGTIEAAQLSGKPEATIAGSGTAKIAQLDAEALELTIAGSGNFTAAGRARKLDLTVAGSGSADMTGLKVDEADISVMGSGDATFASDGTVTASIMGSGSVSVTGSAKCTVKSMGSGSVKCSAGTTQGKGATAVPASPAPPSPPAARDAPPA